MPITSIDDAAWASPWRHRRVGEKVLLCFGLMLTALTAPVWPATALVFAATVAIALGWAKIPSRVYLFVVGVPMTFVVIGVLTIGITIGGQPSAEELFRLGPFAVTRESIRLAGVVFGRSVSGTSAMLLLAMTTPMVDLLTSARKLRIPDVLLEVASLIYRLIFLLLEAVWGVREAQLNRLVDAGTRANRWKAAANGMGAVMMRAWQRAQRLEDGMAARGYENALVTLPTPRPRNWRFIMFSIGVIAAIWTISLLVNGVFW